MNIKYITNVRIPTTRAQGYAIMKMCSEFAKAGVATELFVPDRKNADNIKEDPFDFFKVSKNFKITRIRSFDLLANSTSLGRIFYWLDIVSFLIMAKFSIKLDGDDILYTRDFLIPAFFSAKNKIVLEVHDIPDSKFLFKQAIKKVRAFVVISNGLKSDLIKFGVSGDKILVSPSGVDIQELDIVVDKVVVRKKLGLPETNTIAMYIGLLDDWKGYKTFLEASKLFEDSIQAVVIGGTEGELFPLKKEYPHVIFLGFRPYSELAVNQKSADILVIPNSAKARISKYYTSPLKLFSHMVSRVPIVATRLPSLLEVLNDKNAVFVEPDDVKSLADGIIKLKHDVELGKKIAEQAFSDVQKYSWDSRAKKIISYIHGHN